MMVAFDPGQHRLYVVCRDPGTVVVMNSDTGAVVDTLPAPLRSDEVQYDRDQHPLAAFPGVSRGDTWASTIPAMPITLKLVEKVNTAPGAKTGLLV